MDKIGLFTKSYIGDLDRVVKLSESIEKHNVSDIPFYVSVPEEDILSFKMNLPYYTEILVDEELTDKNKGWVGQQYVKAMFYKMELCEYYVVIDSDSYFIKDFDVHDFMYDNDTPYMVMHENVEFFEWFDRYNDLFPFDYRDSYNEEYTSIKDFLGNGGKKIMDYGPSPFIWNTDVWKLADYEFGINRLFEKHPNELKWYGELAQYYEKEFVSCGPLFKCFHYKAQYEFYKQLGWTEKMFKKQYLGIVMQSNWGAPLTYGE